MTKNLQQLLDEGVDGRHVLVRSDFNVPPVSYTHLTLPTICSV